MGLCDDTEDAPGKETVVVKLTGRDQVWLSRVYHSSQNVLGICEEALDRPLSAPVEAALHDFALALDQAIKDHLNKVRIDD